MTEPARVEELSVSATGLASYRDCAFQSKHKGYSDSMARQVGTAFHRGMEVQGRNTYEAGLQEILNAVVDLGLDCEGTKDTIQMYERIAGDPFYQHPVEKVIAVESDDGDYERHGRKMFQVATPITIDGKRLHLHGAMDKVIYLGPELGLEIIDWKTGFKDPDQFQSEFYAIAAFLMYAKISPITVRMVMTRKGFSKKDEYIASDMPGILQYITVLATHFARETKWEPKFGPACKYCSFKPTCDVYLEKISTIPETPIVDPNNWIAIQTWKQHLSDLSGAVKKHLEEISELEKSYLQKHQKALSLDGNREVYLNTEASSYSYPKHHTAVLLREAGLDPMDAMTLTTGSINDAISNAVVRGTITAEKAKELKYRIEGKKTRKGTWEIEPIRSIAKEKQSVRTRAIKTG